MPNQKIRPMMRFGRKKRRYLIKRRNVEVRGKTQCIHFAETVSETAIEKRARALYERVYVYVLCVYVSVCERRCVCLCAYMRMNERNKKWPASVLVGRPADEGVGFKRNKCWCCSVIFVKKKKQIIKKKEGSRKKEREPKGVETIEGPDILRDLSMSIKKKTKKLRKKNGSNTQRDSLSTWTLPWPAPASASGGAKEREKERENVRVNQECAASFYSIVQAVKCIRFQ